ncbi:MAG: M36 family metallopeptidase [Pirellulales bacterium]
MRGRSRRGFALPFERLENRCLLAVAAGPFDDDSDPDPGGGDPPHQPPHEHVQTVNYFPPLQHVYHLGEYLTEPTEGDPLDIALDYLGQHSTAFGFAPADSGLENYSVSNFVTSDHNGVSHLYMRQTYNGLEVANAAININVTADGRIVNAGSTFLGSLNGPQNPAAVNPTLTAGQALLAVADEFDWSISAAPSVISSSGGTARSQVLGPSGISQDNITAKLQYVPVGPGQVELSWNFVVRTTDGDHWYNFNVSAADGDLIYVEDWVSHARYHVFQAPQEHPGEGVRTFATDPHDLIASPFGWHDINGVVGPEFQTTGGNNVFAQEDILGDDEITPGFRPNGGFNLEFDFPLDQRFDPLIYTEAAIVNAFYWANLTHDIFFQYGFDEEAGNFQFLNYTATPGPPGPGGIPVGPFDLDPVFVDVQDGAGFNNATFATPPDGLPGRMTMFVFDIDIVSGVPLLPFRDGALDAGILVHEYAHGLTNRLTGGGADAGALTAVQSGGMGEGWSDWFALMLTQKPTDLQMDFYPVGEYMRGLSGSGGGIRRFPYSFDMNTNPLTYGDFNGHDPRDLPINDPSEVHNSGEIWASALWDMTWLLINGDGNGAPAQGFDPDLHNGTGGNNLAMQLVIDALKLQPRNPSFLDGRDAILLADQLLTGGENQQAIWTAFARRGMGASASDGGSGESLTVVQAFDMPASVQNPTGNVNIAGTVWHDINGSGVQESGEASLAGWTVYVDLNNNGTRNTLEPVGVTNATGQYNIQLDDPGTYTVRLQLQAGYEQTFPVNNGGRQVVASENSTVGGVNFGARQPAGEVRGTKFHDVDGDGVRDAGEPGLANVVIYADMNNDGSLGIGEPAATSGADGSYRIVGIRPGTFFIREIVQAGWEQTFPGPAANGRHQVEVAPGSVITGINFGNADVPNSVSGRDWGDAPDVYRTLSTNNGASHGIMPGFRLGSLIDGEGNGQPSADGLGDDNAGLSDEDGVIFLSGLTPGQVAQVAVNVRQVGHAPGLIQAWMDFNGDGDWNDSGEQLLRDQAVVDGVNMFSFLVPANANQNPSVGKFARFRFGYERGLSPGGAAFAGEVEDYQVTFPMAADDGLTAFADSYSVAEDSTNTSLDVLANDLFLPGNAPTITAIGNRSNSSGNPANNGTIEIIGGSTLRYTPAPNFFGTETFSYSITDGIGGVGEAFVIVQVTPVNDPPTAVNDTFSIGQNTTNNTLEVLPNDSFAPDVGEMLTIVSVGTPQNGTVQIVGGNRLRYTPAADFLGQDTFTYTINDGTPGSNATATVTINVEPQPDQVQFRFEITDLAGEPLESIPVGEKFLLSTYVQDVRINPRGVFAGYLDATYDSSLVAVDGSIVYGEHYQQALSGNVSTPGVIDEAGATDGNDELGGDEFLLFSLQFEAIEAGEVTFVGNPSDIIPFHGVFVFGEVDVVPNDGLVFIDATLEITAFGAVDDTVGGVPENSEPLVIDVLDNDMLGAGGGTLIVDSVGSPDMGGTAVVTPDGLGVEYQPAEDFTGVETFTYEITDGLGNFDTATVTVSVVSDDDPVDAVNDSFSGILEDSTGNVLDVLDNDVDPADGGLTIVATGPLNNGGTVTISGGGQTLTYTPDEDFFGSETFTYTVEDINGLQDTATVIVNVAAVNDPPDAIDDEFSIEAGTEDNELDVLANDTSAPDAAELLTIVSVDTSTITGTVTIEPDGSGLIYTPPTPGFSGEETFTYTIEDPSGLTDTASVTVVVQPDMFVELELVVTNLAGQSIDQISVGEVFQVHAFTRDLRGINEGGVYAAFLDLFFDPSKVNLTSTPTQFGAGYPEFRREDRANPGLINEIGAIGGSSALGGGDHLLFVVEFSAIAAGAVTFNADPADMQPIHEVLVFDRPTDPVLPEEINYIDDTLTIGGGALHNFANPEDVNADGFVTPSDALSVIRELNTNGGGSVNAMLAGQSLASLMYMDVNADSFVTPRDALMVITRLNNSVAQAAPLTAGTSESSASTLLAAPLTADPLASSTDTTDAAVFGDLDAGYAQLDGGGSADASDYQVLDEDESESAFDWDSSDGSDSDDDFDPILLDIAEDIAVAWGG